MSVLLRNRYLRTVTAILRIQKFSNPTPDNYECVYPLLISGDREVRSAERFDEHLGEHLGERFSQG